MNLGLNLKLVGVLVQRRVKGVERIYLVCTHDQAGVTLRAANARKFGGPTTDEAGVKVLEKCP